MTYSIIGRDESSGEMGVAVQSFYYGCGIRTISARPGIGVVVTQMIPEALYIESGLSRMEAGEPPEVILESLLSTDPGKDTRQIAMMDAAGRVSAYTGKACVAACGQVVGENCSAQGAMVESPLVWQQVMETFMSTPGPLPERLLSALRAGEASGGDIRGRRAAAMQVVSSRHSTSWPEARPFDIRVDDHPDPLAELERNISVQRAMNSIELGFVRGLSGDLPRALKDYEDLATKFPEDPDVSMRYGILLAMAGDIDGAKARLDMMGKVHAGWSKLTGRLIAAGFLPDDPRFATLKS